MSDIDLHLSKLRQLKQDVFEYEKHVQMYKGFANLSLKSWEDNVFNNKLRFKKFVTKVINKNS